MAGLVWQESNLPLKVQLPLGLQSSDTLHAGLIAEDSSRRETLVSM